MRVLASVLTVVTVLLVGGTLAGAQVFDDIIVIPPSNVVRGEPGQVIRVASAPVPAEFVGKACVANAFGVNQSSVHPGNALLVSSGSTSGTVPDYEASAGKVTDVSFPLTLGTTVTVDVVLGAGNKVSSGGLTVSIDCTITTTTSSTTTTTTTVPPSTTAPTTAPTTEPPLCHEGTWDGETCVQITTPPTLPVDACEENGGQAPSCDTTTTSPTPSTLPITGGGEGHAYMNFGAIFALLLGALAILIARRPTPSSGAPSH